MRQTRAPKRARRTPEGARARQGQPFRRHSSNLKRPQPAKALESGQTDA